ncbi:MAG TPA: AsmA-like C-terminal region-containing protein [Opitutus sp.]|nr:AsmA-like C-terminal region-containing protein [Opitutus sp.]
MEPPKASVDVAGWWDAGYKTTVFVFAESASPKIRGTALDYGRTIMFIRPNFFDGLEFFGKQGAGEARGDFVRRIDLDLHEWKDMTFSLTSTLDLATGEGLLGPDIAEKLEPFKFAEAPAVKASGHFDGPAAPGGEHQTMKIEARSTGAFSVYDFPARNLSFDATLQDEELSVERVEADVASGRLAGRAHLSGAAHERKLDFDITLREAVLSEAVTLVSSYKAQLRGEPETPGENVLTGKGQVKFDLALAAAGNFDDLLSYQGNGNAQLSGAELGEVKLLGLLSDLLDFTALRFTTARLDFQLLGKDVVFPSLSVTGENSAIEGHGDYSLANDQMDFNARVYPFQESKSIIQTMVGAMLTPLSTVLEVKLTGPLKQPRWAFVIGPTNFFRSLSQSGKVETPIAPEDAPSTYLKR